MKNKYKNVIQNLNKLKSILIVGNDSEIKNCVSCIKEESDEYVFDKNCKEITSVIVIKNLFGNTFYKIIYNKLYDIYIIKDINFMEKYNDTLLEQEALRDMLEELCLLNKKVILTSNLDVKFLNIMDNKLKEYLNELYVIKI